MSVRSMDGGNPAMLSTFRGDTPRTLLFYNHYDVQPPKPLDKWTSSPFEPLIKEGALHARGAADNRGALVARLAAIRAFLDVYGQLPVGVRYIVEGEEEIGSPHLQAFIDAHREQIGGTG